MVVRKGIVFSTDALFAVGLVTLLLASAQLVVSSSAPENIESVVLERVASDIIAVLDYDGSLQTLSTSQIETDLNAIIPANYEMSLSMDIYDENMIFLETIDVNTDLTSEYYQGKWLFTTFDGTGAIEKLVEVTYKVKFE